MYSILSLLLLLFASTNSLQTVSELDVNKYIGLWYQMYADNIVYNTFEKNSFCDTAKYTIQSDGNIGLHNYAKIGAPNTKLSQILAVPSKFAFRCNAKPRVPIAI